MKRNLFIAAMSLLVMAGCTEGSDELDKIQPQGQDNAIKFTTYVGTQTKATDKSSFGSGEAFQVFAYKTADPYNFSGNLMSNITVTYNGTGWTPTQTTYWPKEGTVDFIAYHPSSTAEVAVNGLKIKGYDVTADQAELLWSTQSTTVTKDQAAPASVSLAFKHALAKIIIQAKLKETYEVTPTIKSIELVQVIAKSGDCLISKTGAEWAASWVTLIDNTAKTTFSLANALSANYQEASQFIIPQKQKANQAIQIVYEYPYYNGSTEKETVTMSFPLTKEWLPGMKYTYSFIISLDNVDMTATDSPMTDGDADPSSQESV